MNPADELRTAATALRQARFPAAMTATHSTAALIRARLPLADWLDDAARYYDASVQAADDVFRNDPTGHTAFLTTGPGAPSPRALTVARAITGTTEPTA